jgi:hypothetical protein
MLRAIFKSIVYTIIINGVLRLFQRRPVTTTTSHRR